MELKEKIDLLLEVIKRFDFYINSTNSKASLVIAWNGIVFGTVLLKYDDILKLYTDHPRTGSVAVVCLMLTALLATISNLIVFWVVFPFLKPTSKVGVERSLPVESMFFFQSVAKLDSTTYFEKISGDSEAEILMDLADQVVVVGRGLNSKMSLLQKSIWCIVGELMLLLALVILKVFT